MPIKHSLWSYALTKKLNCSVIHKTLMKDEVMLNTKQFVNTNKVNVQKVNPQVHCNLMNLRLSKLCELPCTYTLQNTLLTFLYVHF